ncbi:MAG: hypothetical protein QW590_03340 [Candidatus Bilamarchaeaceae archaeon]
MQFRNNAMRFKIETTSGGNREQSSLKKVLLKINAMLLVAGIAVCGAPCSLHEKNEISISQIIEQTKQKTKGGKIEVRKREGFCAVHCKKDGEGPFSSRKTVYEVDFSTDGVYHKEFYSKNGVLIVEGIGNDTERLFRNPNWKDTTVAVRALKIGAVWYPIEDYKGEEAERLWAKVKSGCYPYMSKMEE